MFSPMKLLNEKKKKKNPTHKYKARHNYLIIPCFLKVLTGITAIRKNVRAQELIIAFPEPT